MLRSLVGSEMCIRDRKQDLAGTVTAGPKEEGTERTKEVLASIPRRAMAALLDMGLFLGGIMLSYQAFQPFSWAFGQQAATLLTGGTFMVAFLWQFTVYCFGGTGQTPGKWMFMIRVVREDGQPVTVGLAVLEIVSKYFGTLLLFVDQLAGCFDLLGESRCLHNWICGTVVLESTNQAAMDHEQPRLSQGTFVESEGL
eukprot:TRINITY_DN14222_c0_g1_i1.p1 TRINITY_DN14222_c0_g1~~TRINITY_DN14222_c0_g1_i1.p1  ORF type:complete len:198 (-),score=42.14 TRINITY_DN14222_c0_g1_i1:317-910(-)